MIETAYTIDKRPSAVRFPRGSGYGREKLLDILGSTDLGINNEMPARGVVLPIGKGRIVKRGEVKSEFSVESIFIKMFQFCIFYIFMILPVSRVLFIYHVFSHHQSAPLHVGW